MLLGNMKTDISCNRFGGNGDVIIEHYLDEKMLNDTVVMYDRIRENRNLYGDKMPFEELVNHSVNQSLRRSINTTLTTCLALATICVMAVVFGLDSIFTFAFPLMMGMLSGVYTSLCVSTSCWVCWNGRKPAAKAKKR